MIKSFRHKGLRRLFETGDTVGVQVGHAKRLRLQLSALDTARTIDDMDISGFRLHPLKGSDRGDGPSGRTATDDWQSSSMTGRRTYSTTRIRRQVDLRRVAKLRLTGG